MNMIRTLTVSFCLACICAETVTFLAGPGWPRRCIKALAGLYILVVLLQLLSGAGAGLKQAALPMQSPASFRSTDDVILAQAGTQLEETLEAECKAQFGREVRLKIVLEQNGQSVGVSRAEMTIPPGEDPASCAEAAAYLRQQLGTEVQITAGEATQQ